MAVLRLSAPDNANAIPIRAPISSTVSDSEALGGRKNSAHMKLISLRDVLPIAGGTKATSNQNKRSFFTSREMHTCTGDETERNSK